MGYRIEIKNSSICSVFTWMITLVISIVAVALFHSSHKETYGKKDITISFVLLYGTFALDIISGLTFPYVAVIAVKHTLAVVAQQNLIGFCASNNRFIKPCLSSMAITSLVHGYVLSGWKEFITDAESYRKFNDWRGQWKLESEGCDERLGWSLEKPFDESILLWHLATDFCFHHKDTAALDCATRSIEISNYMMHLLFVNIDMLMAGSRRNLFETACNQLEDMMLMAGSRRNLFETACNRIKGILGSDTSLFDKKKLTEGIIDKVKSKEGSADTFIHDAWELAEGLMDISDDTQMWKAIQGVWLEMLCFSASRCRGYLHAKSLGSGVEYLSYVWLLLAHAGMETFAERLQRTTKLQSSKLKRKHLENQGEDADAPSNTQGAGQLLKKEGNAADPPSSLGMELHREEETAAAPSAAEDEGTAPVLDEIVVV